MQKIKTAKPLGHATCARPRGRPGASRTRSPLSRKHLSLRRRIDQLEAAAIPEPARRTSHLHLLHEAAAALDAAGPPDAGLHRRLLRLAQLCDHWPLVTALGGSLLDEGWASVEDLVDLARASWRQGRVGDAIALAQRAMLTDPHHPVPAALHARFVAWAGVVSRGGCLLSSDQLHLEPLGHQHFDDFFWQFDAEVIERCRLPAFQNARQWHDWLDECHGQDDQRIFGIWHAAWGFCGCVSLVVAGGVGFFYYWIGAGFRGCGLGPEAGRMLLRHAEEILGLRACYATVFDGNAASRRGLLKIGFTVTGVPVRRDAGPPETLFRWPPSDRDVTEEARTLLDAIGAASQVASLIRSDQQDWCSALPQGSRQPAHADCAIRPLLVSTQSR